MIHFIPALPLPLLLLTATGMAIRAWIAGPVRSAHLRHVVPMTTPASVAKAQIVIMPVRANRSKKKSFAAGDLA